MSLKNFNIGYIYTVRHMAEKFKIKNPKSKFARQFNEAIDSIIDKIFPRDN